MAYGHQTLGMEGVVRFLDAADSVHCLKEQFHISRNGGGGAVPGRPAPGSLLADRSHHRLEVQGGPAVRVLQRGVHRYTLSLADPACFCRILDPDLFHHGSRILFPDPGSNNTQKWKNMCFCLTFVGPNDTSFARCHFRAQKSLDSRARPFQWPS